MMNKKNKQSQEAIEIARFTFDWINDWLPTLRTNSPHTVRAYKTAVNLYVRYLETKGITDKTFNAKCFSVAYINDWLTWLKQERKCSNKTCNSRLSGLISLLEYIGTRNAIHKILYLDATASVKRLPEEKSNVQGMTKEMVKAILAAPDPSTKIGLRDLAVMSLEYGTATRIDEVLSLKVSSLKLNQDKPCVTVLGKGNKIRTLYLMSGLVDILRKYLKVFHGAKPDPNDYLFYSSWHGQKAKLYTGGYTQTPQNLCC